MFGKFGRNSACFLIIGQSILIVILLSYFYRKNSEVLQNIRSENFSREETRKAEAAYTQDQLDEINRTLLLNNETLLRKILEVQETDYSLRNMVIEKIVHDYTQTASAYFNESDYTRAYKEFAGAAKYRKNNTTILFYQIYTLYISTQYGRLDGETGKMLLDGIEAMEKRGFQNNELLDFSETEMRQKLTDMAFNIRERAK
ncbi:hypothetical protein FACS1894106_4660 [Spirochaetia bacterium]|nr:hypothetical protein FACS1894106_4660 [Spirochaetia bacterium]